MLVPDAWFWVLCSRCLVSGAWFQVLGSGCLVPCAWFRLTEYKVICYEKFVFNSLKRCYLWVFFLHFVFSLLFASFNFTKLQFIVVSSLMFFDSHSRYLFNDWLSQHIFCIILVRGAWFYSFYNIFCIMLVPDAWFWVLCSRCLVSGAWFQVLGSGCLVPCASFRLTEYKVICYEKFVFNSLKRCYLWVFFLHFVFSILFASFNFTKLKFIVVSSLMFFDSHSRSLFNDWLSQHILCIILVRGAWFYSFYNIFCIMLVPDAWFWVLCSRCLVSGAWFQVLGSGCLVPCAWFRLTEYKVICYEKFVFNSLKRCYLRIFFLHVVFSLLFASFNFTKLQFIVVSSLMFFDSHSRSLFNDWLSQHILCIILVRGVWIYSCYNIFCIILVPDAWFWVLCSRCLVSGAWFQVLGSGCLVPGAWCRLTEYKVICYEKFVFNSLKRCYLRVFFLHVVFSLLFASFNFTKLQFIIVSCLMFFDSHSRSLFNDWLSQHILFIILVRGAWFYSFYNIFCIMLVPDAWFWVLCCRCLVSGAWFQVLGSGCLVPGAWSRLTEYKVICYEKFVFNSLKRCYLWVFFLHFVFSLLFASFNFTKLQFIVVSSLMFFDSHSRYLFKDWLSQHIFCIILVRGAWFYSFYNIFCIMLVPDAWFWVLCSRCLVSGAWFQVLGSGCLVPCAWFRFTEYKVICYEKFVFNSLKRCYPSVFFLHFVFSLLFASFNFTKLQFIVVSSLLFFYSHSRSLFNDWLSQHIFCIILVRRSWFYSFYNLFCIMLVPDAWFWVLCSRCLVSGAWFQVLGSRCSVPGAWFLVLGSGWQNIR